MLLTMFVLALGSASAETASTVEAGTHMGWLEECHDLFMALLNAINAERAAQMQLSSCAVDPNCGDDVLSVFALTLAKAQKATQDAQSAFDVADCDRAGLEVPG